MKRRTAVKKLMIFSTKESRYFAELIARRFPAAEFMGTVRDRFGDGERYLRAEIKEWMDLLGKNVIFVGSTHSDETLEEVCRVGSTIAADGASQIIYVIPFCGYTTMERAKHPGEVVTAKDVATRFSKLRRGMNSLNSFLFLDLHTAGFVHYFEGNPVRRELYGEPVLTQAIQDLRLTNFMFGSADLSRSLWVDTFARKFGTSVAFIRKSRDFEKTEVEAVIGDVRGKIVLIYDDMIRSATTMINAANAYLAEGALATYGVASHFALNNESVIDLLEKSPLKKVIALNTHPMSQHNQVQSSEKFIIKDASDFFVDATRKLIGGNQ